MTRYTVTLPLQDNGGHSLDALHRQLEEQLCDIAGGFTASDSTGCWRSDSGRVYREDVRVYTLDTADPDAWHALQLLAANLAIDARQDAVYITRQDVETDLLTGARLMAPEALA